MVSLEQSIGLKVKIITVIDTCITGAVYAYLPATQLLTLQEDTPAKPGCSNFRLIRTEFIKDLLLLPSQAKGLTKSGKPKYPLTTFAKAAPAMHAVDTGALETKVATAVSQRAAEVATLNKQATPHGQAIFHKLHKMLPDVKWAGTAIVVLGDVTIGAPYSSKDISHRVGAKENPLIGKIVQGYWSDLEATAKGG